MYCKKCGKEMHDEDRFCANCGTPVPQGEVNNETPDPEGVKTVKIDTSEFVWNVHDFSKPERKTENVTVDWEKGTVTEINEAIEEMTEETAEAVNEAVSEIGEDDTLIEEVTEAAEEILEEEIEELEEALEQAVETENFAGINVPKVDESFAWTAPIRLDDIEAAIEEERAVTLEDIKRDIAPNPNRERDTAKIEKFYTLNKKNEEFQKLLDMEYERIRAGREGSYIVTEAGENSYWRNTEVQQPAFVQPEEAPAAQQETETVQPEAQDIPETKAEPEVFDPVAHLKKAEEERNAALGIAAGASVAEMAEAYEIQKRNNVYYDDNGEEMRIFDTMELQKDLLETGASLKAKNELINDISEKIASTKEDVEKTYTDLLDEIFGQISNAGTGAAAAGAAVVGAAEVAEAVTDEPEVHEVPETEEVPEVQEITETISDAIESPEEEIEEIQEEAPCEVPETEESSEAEVKDPEDTILPEAGHEVKSFYDDDDEPPKKRGFLKFIIWLVVILLLAECAVLAIQHFMPESKAAAFINAKLSGITDIIKPDGGNADDTPYTDDTDQDAQDDEPDVVIDTRVTPQAILTPVIESLSSANENIASITYDAGVKYDAGKKYNSDTVHNTVPLTTNVLSEDENGVRTYVDEEALETLIRYNSGWISYVNDGDQTIFSVLEEGSDAYKNTSGFKANGMKKTFDSLRIGEIRTDGTGYYVWAAETITTTKAGKTTTDEFAWVYYMEPDGSELKIVDYYK